MAAQLARTLRRNSTEAEKTLWRELRNGQIAGHKFRRQQPIGRYVADFACQRRKLIIELDGGQHANDSPERTQFLNAVGYRVLRFWNNEILKNLPGVLQTIASALAEQDS